MRDYNDYELITNFTKECELQILLSIELSGLMEYCIREAYDRCGNPRPDMFALIVKKGSNQDFEIHKFFQYNAEFSLRYEEILKKNGFFSSDYKSWTSNFEIAIGYETTHETGEIKYFPRKDDGR